LLFTFSRFGENLVEFKLADMLRSVGRRLLSMWA